MRVVETSNCLRAQESQARLHESLRPNKGESGRAFKLFESAESQRESMMRVGNEDCRDKINKKINKETN